MQNPQSHWSFLPPANVVCEGYVSTGVCLSTGGACMCGGEGVCVAGGHAWQGACVPHIPPTTLWDTVGQCTGGTYPTGMHSCPKCFHWIRWIQWQKVFVIKRTRTCHLLCNRPGCYHSASKTHVKDNSCFSDLSDSLKSMNSMKVLFHLGKIPLIQIIARHQYV